MSVLIKGFKMPTHCIDCVLEEDGYCFLINDVVEPLDRPRSCPLVEAPTPHGRLVDADKLEKTAFGRAEKKGDFFNAADRVITFSDIEAAPTVIEGEE